MLIIRDIVGYALTNAAWLAYNAHDFAYFGWYNKEIFYGGSERNYREAVSYLFHVKPEYIPRLVSMFESYLCQEDQFVLDICIKALDKLYGNNPYNIEELIDCDSIRMCAPEGASKSTLLSICMRDMVSGLAQDADYTANNFIKNYNMSSDFNEEQCRRFRCRLSYVAPIYFYAQYNELVDTQYMLKLFDKRFSKETADGFTQIGVRVLICMCFVPILYGLYVIFSHLI